MTNKELWSLHFLFIPVLEIIEICLQWIRFVSSLNSLVRGSVFIIVKKVFFSAESTRLLNSLVGQSVSVSVSILKTFLFESVLVVFASRPPPMCLIDLFHKYLGPPACDMDSRVSAVDVPKNATCFSLPYVTHVNLEYGSISVTSSTLLSRHLLSPLQKRSNCVFFV